MVDGAKLMKSPSIKPSHRHRQSSDIAPEYSTEKDLHNYEAHESNFRSNSFVNQFLCNIIESLFSRIREQNKSRAQTK